ncbi:MAG: hypothetical protein GXO76_04035 [Calditrichaeota bacterium]|nr:hypothetical protein [Calditrichota bacterium]
MTLSKIVRWLIWFLVIAGSIFMFLQINDFAHAQERHPLIHQLELARHEGEPPVYRSLQKPAVVLPLLHRATAPEKVIYGYLPYWSSAAYLNYSLLTTIAYFGAEFDGSGRITNHHGWPVWSLINKAHSHGVRVDLVAICFNKDKIHSILTNAAARSRFIQTAVAEVKKGHADGLNVDFELPYSSDSRALSSFMAALTDSFHAAIPGSRVTIATTAVNWGGRFDRRALASGTDGMMIMGYDYHWSGSSNSGAVAPLTGGTYNVTNTVLDYLIASDYHREKLILGVPYYGYEWKTNSNKPGSGIISSVGSRTYQQAEPAAQRYGKRWDSYSQTPWYTFNDGTNWHQCWYDDSLSLSLKYNLVLKKDLAGIGIWALGYDGPRKELWGALRDHFVSSLDSIPPFEPTHFFAQSLGDGKIAVGFRPVSGATGYLISKSLDGTDFDQGTLFSDSLAVFSDLLPDTVYYFRVQAVNAAGLSSATEMLAATTLKAAPRLLVVNGFDRVAGTKNTRDFIRQHAQALWARHIAFSAASNEAIETGKINLADFAAVDWILGEEGTDTESFSATEQEKVKSFLEKGGDLFVSGSEIGYDLVEKGSSADQAFYRDYLKAAYVTDRAGKVHSASGTTGSIFHGLTHIQFDDGSHGGYNVDYPDGIKPAGGSVLAMIYDGVNEDSQGGAAIQYEGKFGNSAQTGRLVYMAFPFEMIYQADQRNQVMQRILDFFDVDTSAESPSVLPENFTLEQNYPNPVSAKNGFSTTLQFTVSRPAQVNIYLYDVLGRRVRTLFQGKATAGENRVQANLRGLPAGMPVFIFIR